MLAERLALRNAVPPLPTGAKAPAALPAPAEAAAPKAKKGTKGSAPPPVPVDAPPEVVPIAASVAARDGAPDVVVGNSKAVLDMKNELFSQQLALQMEFHASVKAFAKAWKESSKSSDILHPNGPLKDSMMRMSAAAEPVLREPSVCDFSWMEENDAPPTQVQSVKGSTAPDSVKPSEHAGKDSSVVIMHEKEKPRSGELTYDEAKKLKNLAVETFFVDVRSHLRLPDGAYAITSQHLFDWVVNFNPVAVATCGVKHLVPWAEHVTNHPMLNVEFDRVLSLVKKSKVRTKLELDEGGMQLEILGVIVQTYVEKLRRQRRHYDPSEKEIAFSVKVGNLICTKAAILGSGKLALAHHLGIVELAKGAGTWLPEYAEDKPEDKPEDEVQKATEASSFKDRVGRRGERGGSGPSTTGKATVPVVLKFPKRKCIKCNGHGHRAKVCTSKEGATLECWRCKGTGHPEFKCASELA